MHAKFFLSKFGFQSAGVIIKKRSRLSNSNRFFTPLFLGSMSVYQILRNCQCLNGLRVRIYDLGTLTTWLLSHVLLMYLCQFGKIPAID